MHLRVKKYLDIFTHVPLPQGKTLQQDLIISPPRQKPPPYLGVIFLLHPLVIMIIAIKLLIATSESGPEMFCKKCILKNFAKFTEKRLCQNFFFNSCRP